MKILLFNDNPVVRKLVALSAQKTKDELNVVWSVDEIDEGSYDLVIIDDALYSDEMFNSLKEVVHFKTTLLMATRGNGVPAGFDHVINKPFLPTDLVDLFAKIDADLGSKGEEKRIDLDSEALFTSKKETYPAIDLEEPFLGGDAPKEEEDLLPEGLDDFSEPFSMDEEEPFPAVLDREEVQEVRGLLEDTEDEWMEPEGIPSLEGDDFAFDELDIPSTNESPEKEEEFDFEGLDLDEEIAASTTPEADLSLPDAEELSDQIIDDAAEAAVEKMSDDELLLDDMLLDNEDSLTADEALSDEAFGELELKIQEAVGDLGAEDMDMELEDAESFDFGGLDLDEEIEVPDISETLEMSFDETLGEMNLEDEELLLDENELLDEDELLGETDKETVLDEELDDDLLESLTADAKTMDTFAEDEEGEAFDELDMLDERELKLAIGEEMEEETQTQAPQSTRDSVFDDLLEDGAEDLGEQVSPVSSVLGGKSAGVDGAEALQTLLKALANEDVVKALKGLNISININFGNDK